MGRHKNFTREEVLDSAIQLFWEKGFAETSLSDLENTTGVNKSGLYSEFKDKNDIFHECIKRYRDTHTGFAILDRAPHGWKNIEDFMKSSMTCSGRKGCFFNNSLRESSIIPSKAKAVISETSTLILELIEKNLIAEGFKKNTKSLANMIVTFSAGICLKLNSMKPESLMSEVEIFLQILKTK